jgi:NitT/TauT family transport system substrate-binding protein
MLADGTADIITSELIQAMMTADDDIKYVNLLQTTQHSTLVLISRAGDVKKLSDLAGSRIGTWKVGFSEIPHMIDEEQHLDIEWVKLINSLNLYIAGAIDATLAKSYNELILFSMAGVTPGSVLYFSEYGYDFPEDGLYVSEEFYKNNKEQCRKFAEASRRGWDWVRNNREEALDIVMKYVKESKIPTNRYNQKWMLEAILEAQQDEKGGRPSYRLDEDAFNQLNEALLKYGYISEPVVYERFTGGEL